MQNINDDWNMVLPLEFVGFNQSASKPNEEFHRFLDLPTLVKFHIIALLDKKSLLNMSSVCKEMNRIVLPIITQRFMLAIQFVTNQDREAKAIANMFAAILENESNGRSYNKMVLKNIHWALNADFQPLVFHALSVIGESVKELVICETNFSSLESALKLLRCFKFIEKLTLTAVNVYFVSESNADGLLPNLKQLVMDRTSPKAINWFRDCHQLERLEFDLDDFDRTEFNEQPLVLENFLLQQYSLKYLTLNNLLQCQLFGEDRSEDVKFQLDAITLSDTFFANEQNTLKFFKTQRRLKFFETSTSYDDDVDNVSTDVLKFVYALPTLEKVTTSRGVNDSTSFTINPLVKCAHLSLYAGCEVIKSMMKIFPNLKDIYLVSTYLKLDDFPIDKLQKLTVWNGYDVKFGSLFDFRYHQPVSNVNQKAFEIMMKCFLLRNRKIKRLVIGHSIWIDNNFGLSLKFCQDVLRYLPDLTSLELYNPLQMKHFVMLLLCQRRKFESIILHTNQAGKAAVARMNKRCLKIVTE